MNHREIQLLYCREMRAALRERNIVINSLLVPILLYPLILWVIFSAISLVQGQEERFSSRIALSGLPPVHAEFATQLRAQAGVELVPQPAAHDAWTQIQDGTLDVFAEVGPPGPEARALADNFAVRWLYDGSKDRSRKAVERLRESLDAYRDSWLKREAEQRGVSASAWQQFALERENTASSRQVGGFVLGLIAPLLMTVMIAFGCFYPAIDATAGERERSTWETTLTLSAARQSIVIAKYLYVATLGAVAGWLNLLALAVSLRTILAPLLRGHAEQLDFQIPWQAVPILVLAVLLFALFVAAGMMLFASFARTFKEGQSMISPFYLLTLLPMLFANSPELTLTPQLALIPILNLTLVLREAISATFNWPLIGLTFAVELATIAMLLALARRVLRTEDVVHAGQSSSLGQFLRRQLARREPT